MRIPRGSQHKSLHAVPFPTLSLHGYLGVPSFLGHQNDICNFLQSLKKLPYLFSMHVSRKSPKPSTLHLFIPQMFPECLLGVNIYAQPWGRSSEKVNPTLVLFTVPWCSESQMLRSLASKLLVSSTSSGFIQGIRVWWHRCGTWSQ